VVEIIFSNL